MVIVGSMQWNTRSLANGGSPNEEEWKEEGAHEVGLQEAEQEMEEAWKDHVVELGRVAGTVQRMAFGGKGISWKAAGSGSQIIGKKLLMEW